MKDYTAILANISDLKRHYVEAVSIVEELEYAMSLQALWGGELKGAVSCGIRYSVPGYGFRDMCLEIRHGDEKREFRLDDVPAQLRTRKLLEFLDREKTMGEFIGPIMIKKHCQKKGWLPDGPKLCDVKRPKAQGSVPVSPKADG